MSPRTVTTQPQSIRRLTVAKQHLAGKLPTRPTPHTIISTIRDVAYIQWDPVPIVAPSHVLSLWSRLGDFRTSDLDGLLWRSKKLFLHWTPVASIVLTEDYPLYHSLMRRYPESLSKSWGSQRTQAKVFLRAHQDLRDGILRELEAGPITIRQFRDHARSKRDDGEWTPASDVAHMLFHLSMSGEIMVVGHRGNQNLWGVTDQFLPEGTEKGNLTADEAEREAAVRALRALGTATRSEITYHFVRGRYDRLKEVLSDLEEESIILRVEVEGFGDREVRYIHADDVPLLDTLEGSGWQPRMSLLPPFDNMVINSARTSRVFGFDYVREQFLPAEKRRFGTYVLPILWGDRFIGRIDAWLDKAEGELVINAVHAEPGAPADRNVAELIAETVSRLATFLGARKVRYTPRVPRAWARALR